MLNTEAALTDLEQLAAAKNLRITEYATDYGVLTFFDHVRSDPTSHQYVLTEERSSDGATRGTTTITRQNGAENTSPLSDDEYERYCAIVKTIAAMPKQEGELSRYVSVSTSMTYRTTVG